MLSRLHKHLTRAGLGAAASFAAAFGVLVSGGEGRAAESAVSGSTWTASEDDYLLLQLMIKNYRLSNDVRGYKTNRGVCLDLADTIQALDLPVRLDKKSRRATGWLFAEDQQITIDREANKVQNVNTGTAPLGSDIHDTPEGWCVEVDALSRWFGIRLKPDLFNSVIKMESDTELPFMQAIERRSRAARLRAKPQAFDLSKFPHAEMEYRAWRTPSVDVVARAGYRGGNGTRSQVKAQAELFVAGEALGASYHARLATDDSLQPESLRLRAYRNDPDGGLLGLLKATQVAAGDVQTQAGELTGQSAVGRGAFISNQPLGRGSRFSTITLRGILPGGWDAELYRNGQLLAFQGDSDDGRYEFIDVDLFFGRNDLEVVLYGPQGQIRRERTTLPIGGNLIEPGQTYYWAGILQNDRDLIDFGRSSTTNVAQEWRWGVGVEHGLDKRTSVSLGAQSLFYDGHRRHYVEGAVSRILGGTLARIGAAYEYGEGGVLQGNVAGRLGVINYNAYALKSFGNFSSEFVGAGIDYRTGLQFDTSLKLGRFSLPLQAAVSRSRLKDGSSSTEFLASTAVATGPIALSVQLEHERQEGRPGIDDRSDTRLRLLANTRIKGLRLRGNASFDLSGEEQGLDTVRVTAEKPIGDRGDIRGEVEYMARLKDTRFSLGYSHRFDRLALRGDLGYTTNGAIGANLSLSFSIGPDPAGGGFRMSENKLARFGQAAVTVFRDDNGDGLLSAGEELLKEVNVEAGLRHTDAVTGANGTAIVDGLKPYVPVLVGVDEASLGDPYLAPSVKGVVVVPRPGIAAQVLLPITASGEVEGILLSLTGLEQAGVVLELIDGQGRVVSQTMSEYDGFFLFERVPYGRYALRVANDAARKLQVRADIAKAVTVERAADIARLGAIKLAPAREIIAGAGGGGIGGAQSP